MGSKQAACPCRRGSPRAARAAPICFACVSPHRAVYAFPLVLAENQLPELPLAGAEKTRAAQQIVFPHTVEALAVFGLEEGPGRVEVLPPRHQGAVVIRPEFVPVLDQEAALHC